jgi:hypothetical protein
MLETEKHCSRFFTPSDCRYQLVDLVLMLLPLRRTTPVQHLLGTLVVVIAGGPRFAETKGSTTLILLGDSSLILTSGYETMAAGIVHMMKCDAAMRKGRSHIPLACRRVTFGAAQSFGSLRWFRSSRHRLQSFRRHRGQL